MPSPSLLKFPGSILAHAKTLIAGDEARAAPMPTECAPSAPELAVDDEWDMERQNKTFWLSMIAADRRLAELRRVIDEAAAEAIARETAAVEAQPIQPGESRYEMANRMIANALNLEKS